MNKIIHTLLLLLLSSSLWAHPIKMSTGRMEVNTKENTISIVMNFFIDDFESALRVFYPQPPFDFDNPSDVMTFSINDYVRKNLIIKADKSKVDYKLVSLKNSKENVCQATFKGNNEKLDSCQSISIQNSLLFDTYERQSNILHLKIDSQDTKILEFFPRSAVKVVNR